MERPRVRSIETKQELPIPSYEAFASDDQLLEAALNRMLYGMSSRDYGHGIEDYSDVAEVSGISKSSISRRFIKAGEAEAKKVLIRRFETETIPVLLIDGVVLGDYTAAFEHGHYQRWPKADHGCAYRLCGKRPGVPGFADRSNGQRS